MEDERIVDLYWERSEAAITETSEKYGRFCYSIAYNILTSTEDSEECTNDTWLAAWRSMPPHRPNFLRAFLGKITRNLAWDRYDYHHAKKRNRDLDQIMSELGEFEAVGESVEEAYQAGETARLISDFLRGLPAEQRQVFLRRYWYCDSISEVAKLFAMSESKVKSMLFRIRNQMRQYLAKEGITV